MSWKVAKNGKLMFPNEDECEGCGAILPAGRRGQPTGHWTFVGNLLCWSCAEALAALGEVDLSKVKRPE